LLLIARKRRDRDVVVATVKLNSWALQFADESLQSDREVVSAAASHVSEGGIALLLPRR